MISYYELTKNLYNTLIANEDVNTVEIGDLNNVDLDKQTIFPLAHIFVTDASFLNGVTQFNVAISCMDVLNFDNDKQDKDWKGQDNKQYIINTMLAVLESLQKSMQNGALDDLGWEVQGLPTITKFEDRFENVLTGWTMELTIHIPNTVQACE